MNTKAVALTTFTFQCVSKRRTCPAAFSLHFMYIFSIWMEKLWNSGMTRSFLKARAMRNILSAMQLKNRDSNKGSCFNINMWKQIDITFEDKNSKYCTRMVVEMTELDTALLQWKGHVTSKPQSPRKTNICSQLEINSAIYTILAKSALYILYFTSDNLSLVPHICVSESDQHWFR